MDNYLDVSLVMNQSWDVFKEKWVRFSAWVLAMFLVILAPYLLSLVAVRGSMDSMTASTEAVDLTPMFIALGCLFFGLLCYVVINIYFMSDILNVAKGVKRNLKFSTAFRAFVVMFIVGFIAYISIYLCVIPFFIVFPRIMLAPLYVLDNPQMGIGEALSNSMKATKGKVLVLLLLGFIAYVISNLGSLCFIVGAFPAIAFVTIMQVVIYLTLSGQNLEDYEEVSLKEESFVIEEKTVCRD